MWGRKPGGLIERIKLKLVRELWATFCSSERDEASLGKHETIVEHSRNASSRSQSRADYSGFHDFRAMPFGSSLAGRMSTVMLLPESVTPSGDRFKLGQHQCNGQSGLFADPLSICCAVHYELYPIFHHVQNIGSDSLNPPSFRDCVESLSRS